MARRLANAYLLTKVLTATNQEVIVYLYEGAIGYLHRATTALDEGRFADAAAAIDRVVNIVIELSGGLDYQRGGAVAARLDSIYNGLLESLSLAQSRHDRAALEACSSILTILHDAWRQAGELTANAKDQPRLCVSA